MATLNSLMDDVYILTNRPELVAETRLAVKKATLKLHQLDFFAKDIYETGIVWNPIAYIQSLAYSNIHPRWRKLKYIRKYQDGAPGEFFTILTPEETLDRYGVQKENICYLAGDNYEIKSSTQDEYMLLGAYIHPDITDAGFSSWIANEHPYAVVIDAAASVFKAIGQDEKAAYFKQEVVEHIALLRQNQI